MTDSPENDRHYRVLADYEVNDPHPLELAAGEVVQLRRKDLSWPGWVWVEAGERAGWIPEDYLEDSSKQESHTRRAFDGRDLSARRGDLLEFLDSAPGWIYARRNDGTKGWFPLFNLKPFRNT